LSLEDACPNDAGLCTLGRLRCTLGTVKGPLHRASFAGSLKGLPNCLRLPLSYERRKRWSLPTFPGTSIPTLGQPRKYKWPTVHPSAIPAHTGGWSRLPRVHPTGIRTTPLLRKRRACKPPVCAQLSSPQGRSHRARCTTHYSGRAAVSVKPLSSSTAKKGAPRCFQPSL